VKLRCRIGWHKVVPYGWSFPFPFVCIDCGRTFQLTHFGLRRIR
jgi:hypothetical protein